MTATAGAERLRNLVFFRTPKLWQVWPFLPLMRRTPGREEECGLLYDARGQSGLMGYSATVFLCNLFLLPPTLEEFLALPREAHDTPEEVYDAGWRVD
jgi:hypothetical protein